MNYFVYKLLQHDGRLARGIVKRPRGGEDAIRAYLEERFSLPVLSVWRMPLLLKELYVFFVRFFRAPVKTEDIAEFLRNLAVMLRSGIPVMVALEDSVDDAKGSPLQSITEELFLGIESGMSLSEAMERHPDVFPNSVLFLVRIGEESGNVDRTLLDASKHLDRVRNMQRDTKRAMIYPAFVFVTIFCAAAFWMVYVVPGMTDLFKQMSATLPPLTQALMSLSDFLQRYIAYIIVAIVVLALLIVYLIRNHYKTRLIFHHILIKMPVTKGLVRSSSQAYLSEYMSLLISAGVDIVSSLEILENAMSNEVYKLKVAIMRDEIINGHSLERAFRNAGIFPGFVVRMISVGEQSGTLTEQLDYIATEYRARLDHAIQTLSEAIKPAVILFAGALFGLIIAGLFLPVYQLIGQMGSLR
ncbi:MAG: type II secretion system F family protein [Mariprofundaceae bacterium]